MGLYGIWSVVFAWFSSKTSPLDWCVAASVEVTLCLMSENHFCRPGIWISCSHVCIMKNKTWESWKHSSHHPKTVLLCEVIGFRTFGSFLGNWTGGLTSWGSQHRSVTCESEGLDICQSLATFGCSPGLTYFTVLKSQWCMNLLPDVFARANVICVLITVSNVFPRGLNQLYWWLYLDMEAWTAQMRKMFVHRKLPSGQPGVSLRVHRENHQETLRVHCCMLTIVNQADNPTYP